MENSDYSDIQIQKGKFSLSGTPNYMSPILKERFLHARKKKLQDVKLIDVDLFKSDIYSLGLTFLQAATNIDISIINESEDHMKMCEEALEATTLP